MKCGMLLLFVVSFFYGQAQETTSCYFDEELSLTTKKLGVYTGTITAQGDNWEAVAFYPDGNVIMRGLYKDKKLKVKQGLYTLYYPNGNRRAFTSFTDNHADSIYMSWYSNGQLGDSGFIRQQVRTGLWKTWYSNGQIESSGSYNYGAPDGLWHWYHSNGYPATMEWYKDNKLQDLSCFDTLGVQTGSNCRIEKKPCPQGTDNFEAFIIEHLLYPNEALKKEIEGVVAFEFLITKEGRLTNINFTNEAHVLLQEEVVRLLKSVKEWEPAVSHNRNVEYLYSYSVPFYLPD